MADGKDQGHDPEHDSPHCCSQSKGNIGEGYPTIGEGVSRRGFLVGLGAAGMGAWAISSSASADAPLKKPVRKMGLRAGTPLRVKPVLVYQLYQRREMTSWRGYGGLHTGADVDEETKRIEKELAKLASAADFPMEMLPLTRVNTPAQANALKDCDCDTLLVFASGGSQQWLEALAASGKPNVMFLRHKSGPIYLWYEIAHWRFLRKSEEDFTEPNMDVWDIVVDDYEEVLWRLRSLYGLKNSMGTKVVGIGGLEAYSRPGQLCGPTHAKEVWKFGIETVSYDELARRLKEARANEKTLEEIERRTDDFLAQKWVSLHTDRKFVVNSFLAAKVFKEIMAEMGATSLGVAGCMGRLIRVTDTPPCLVLGWLNDEGFTAFCHCDFTHTPAGVLLHHISGKPSWVSNSHYPYNGILTLAHCAAPMKMNGRDYEPTKIVTHFESDYGAAPKVNFRKGQVITTIVPDLSCKKWIGFRGEIMDSPSYDICRSQIDMKIDGDWRKLLEDMRGFHTLTCYGDYLREVGYACKKVGIEWENITTGRNI